MIPVKIISFEEALKQGLTKVEQEKRGLGVVAAGCVMNKKTGEIVQKSIVKDDGTHELVHMTDERKKFLKDAGVYEEHLEQFGKILGEKKEVFFAKNNLKLKQQV